MKSKVNIICILAAFLLLFPFQSCQKVEKVKKDVLEYSLNALGDKLFSLIPNGSTKTNLEEKYDDFVQRAVNGDVEQNQIEYVAANILNATNSQDTIQPDLAKSIVGWTDSNFNADLTETEETAAKKSPMSSSQTTSLGENLDKILKINDNLKSTYTKNHPDNNFGEKVFYKFDKGIVMTLDENIKSSMKDIEFKEIFVELDEMEKIHKMEWKKELSKTLKKEHEAFREEMKKLKELKIKYQGWEGMNEIEIFSSTDSNFYMPHIPEVNLDSIMKALELSLEGLDGIQKIIIEK